MKEDKCGKCSVELTDDTWHPSHKRRRWLVCKTCENARQRDYNHRNPEITWKRNYQRRYGITFDQYQALLQAQEEKCAICGTDDSGRTGRRMYVDHCHATGEVRGLLCHGCNTGLGHFKDNIDSLKKAAEYLCMHST